VILSYIHHMTEKNSQIPNMYITQSRLRCRLNQIAFHPSIWLLIVIIIVSTVVTKFMSVINILKLFFNVYQGVGKKILHHSSSSCVCCRRQLNDNQQLNTWEQSLQQRAHHYTTSHVYSFTCGFREAVSASLDISRNASTYPLGHV
jgi:hypothetical protein